MIDNFYDLFTAEIRQIVVNDRMKMMCTEKKFIETITYYDTKTLKKEELKIINEIFRTMIKNMLTQAKKKI